MIRMARVAACALGAATVALIATPGTAGATLPAPDGPTWPAARIEVVPVPVRVPVDDRAAELLQMQIAAVLGAVVTAGVTAARRRHQDRTRSAQLPLPGTVRAVTQSDLTAVPSVTLYAELTNGPDDVRKQ
jgi:hypothetical protein